MLHVLPRTFANHRLEGLALERNHNPLAEPPGSIVAGVVALLVIGAAGAFAIRRGREPSA